MQGNGNKQGAADALILMSVLKFFLFFFFAFNLNLLIQKMPKKCHETLNVILQFRTNLMQQ